MKLLIADTTWRVSNTEEALEEIGYEVDGYIECFDFKNVRALQKRFSKPLIWWEDTTKYIKTHKVVNSLGSAIKREKAVSILTNMGFEFLTFVHKDARVSKSTEIGYGSYIDPGVYIGSNCKIGEHNVLYSGSQITHDVELGNFVTVCRNSVLAGGVKIGHNTFIGIGSNIIEGKIIGNRCIVAAAACVINDFSRTGVTIAGVPAKIKGAMK
jgi:acetyltransferase EpsM